MKSHRKERKKGKCLRSVFIPSLASFILFYTAWLERRHWVWMDGGLLAEWTVDSVWKLGIFNNLIPLCLFLLVVFIIWHSIVI